MTQKAMDEGNEDFSWARCQGRRYLSESGRPLATQDVELANSSTGKLRRKQRVQPIVSPLEASLSLDLSPDSACIRISEALDATEADRGESSARKELQGKVQELTQALERVRADPTWQDVKRVQTFIFIGNCDQCVRLNRTRTVHASLLGSAI